MSDLSADLDAALARLASRDVERRVGAVEDLGHIMNQVIDHVIEEFAEPGPARATWRAARHQAALPRQRAYPAAG